MSNVSHLISIALLFWSYRSHVKVGLSENSTDADENEANVSTIVSPAIRRKCVYDIKPVRLLSCLVLYVDCGACKASFSEPPFSFSRYGTYFDVYHAATPLC